MKNLIFVCVQFTQIKNIPLHVPLSVAYPTIYFGCIENSMKRKCSIYSILIIFSISWLLPNHFHQMRVRACNVKCKIFNSIWTVIKVCQAWFQIYTMYYLTSLVSIASRPGWCPCPAAGTVLLTITNLDWWGQLVDKHPDNLFRCLVHKDP